MSEAKTSNESTIADVDALNPEGNAVEDALQTPGSAVEDNLKTPAHDVIPDTPADVGKEAENETEKLKPVSLAKMFSMCTGTDWILVFFGSLGALGNALSQPIMIIIFGEMIDAAGPATLDIMETMTEQIHYMNICAAAAWVAAGMQSFCLRLLAHRLTEKIRIRYYEAVLLQDISWFDVHEVAALPTEISADMQRIAEAFGDKLGGSIMGIFCFFGSFACAFILGWQVALMTCATVPFICLGSLIMAKALQEVVEETQTWYSKAAATIEECLFAFRTVVSFGGEFQELNRYTKAVVEARRGGVKNASKTGIGLGYTEGIMCLCYALALWYGSTLIYGGTVNPKTDKPWQGGEILSVFFCVFIGGFMLSQVEPGVKAMAAAQVSGARIFAALENAPKIQRRGQDERKVLTEINSIALKDVKFSYPARPHIPILNGASLTIKRGQKVALVGESGCGKSTIMSLLERFYDPSEGIVMVNDVDIREFAINSVRRHIGYVGQEPVLFATSIKMNILQGWPDAQKEVSGRRSTAMHISDVLQEALERVSQDAQLDFVKELPEGLETYVGSGGTQFSGGQKQRIAIARALLKSPTVLFLDEATSALDNASEKMIQGTIDSIGSKSEMGMTIVSIAHRLSTIQSSDVIYALKEGVVVESGTHDELMKMEGLYYALAASQQMADNEGEEKLERQESGASKGKSNSNIRSTVQNLQKGMTQATALDDEEKEALRQKEIGANYKVPMKRLLQYNKPEWVWFLPGIIGAIGHGASQPILSYVMVQTLDSFYKPRDEMKKDVEMLCLGYVAVAVLTAICCFLQMFSFGVMGEALGQRLRVAILTHVFTQEIGFHDDPKHTPTLIGDALQYWAFRVGVLLNSASQHAGVFGSISTGVVIAFVACWQMALVMLGAVPILALTTAVQMIIIMGGTKAGDEQARSQQILSDSLQNARTVHASGIEKVLVEHYTILVKNTADGMLWRCFLAGMAFGLATSVPLFVMSGGMYFGAHLVENGNADFLGIMAAFMGILYAGMGAGQASMTVGDVAKAKVACHDMFQLLDRQTLINGLHPDGEEPEMPKADAGEIEFQNVQFYYPFRPEVQVLKGVSFQIKAGQSVGLVGPSGGGKSTIMGLIQRFYDPVQGNVLIGPSKMALSKLNIRWWRKQIGFVGQEPILFDTTVRKNVLYGEDEESITEDWLESCKKMSHLSFIDSSKGQGWQTEVGPRGSRLSGGQKQRVAICRALLRNPPLLLLDEATSALDTASEKVVQQALESARVGRTSIAIAHRLSTISDCDVILVAAEGVILEHGTHHELMEKHGVYYKLQKQAKR